MAIEAIKNKDGSFSFKGKSFKITEDKNKALEPFNKQVWDYGLVLYLLPDNDKREKINQQIGNARFVANNYLDEREKLYKEKKEFLSVATYKKEYLPKLKEENEFLLKSDKFALENAIENIDDAFNKFYKALREKKVSIKNGKLTYYPKYVSKYKPNGNSYSTKFTNDNIEIVIENNIPYIKLPKVGKVRIVLPKKMKIEDILPFNTKILRATIKRSSCNINENTQYTVSLQLETVIDKINPLTEVSKKDICASDMGIKDFAIYGNEDYTQKEENPHWIKVHSKRIRRLQKSLARKQYNQKEHKGSKNYYKTKEKLAKEHRKIKNQRKDFHHKLSRKIVNNCNVFICEDLNIKGMVKNHKLAKEISSVGWGQFLTFIEYKLKRKDGIFIKVNKFFASSKLCSCCGYKNTELTLKDRIWTCPNCNTKHDRDINAKNNLLKEGIRILTNDYKVIVK